MEMEGEAREGADDEKESGTNVTKFVASVNLEWNVKKCEVARLCYGYLCVYGKLDIQ